MNPIKANTQVTRFLATGWAVLAMKAAPWRRSVGLATLALVLGGIVSTARAGLLVYEPFDYPPSIWGVESFNGQNGGTGFASESVWGAINSGSAPMLSPYGFAICVASNRTLWNGTVVSVPQAGNYAGSPVPTAAGGTYTGNNPDHESAWRPLDPSVVATFTQGSTTWMSYVEASNFKANANTTGGMLALGSGYFDNLNRGNNVQHGTAIGIGINYSTKRFTAAYWTATTTASGSGNVIGPTSTGTPFSNTSNGKAQIGICKIVWGNATDTPTTIYQTTFTDGDVLTEDAFNNSPTLVINTPVDLIDPSTYTFLSLGGARYNVDELRLGTTFNDVIGVIPATDGPYWAPGLGGGGDGTWSNAAPVWASIPNAQGTLPQRSGATLIFSGTNVTSTVTIDGTVTPNAGLTFSVTGYSVVPGSSSPNLNLAGADAAANTITVSSGTATISAQVTGSAGMTKVGAGTLVLSGTGNTYGGGTTLDVGTLQIAGVGSLGSGNVVFGGGILQYPPGSGTSAIDVSGKIPTVASGQTAKIDTDGYDVTFGTAIGGDGGLTKLGSGSLRLGLANTYAGPTTVSGGVLNVSSASGTVGTLNVPTGGTVNLEAGAVVTTLNITGGTVNLAGAGVQVGTLFASGGTLTNASGYSLTITNSAGLNGVTLTLGGASSFTLNGADLLNPTTVSRLVTTATGGALSVVTTGLDVAIGIAAPGANATPATTTFSGNGVWAQNGGVAATCGNVYGRDNHAFHYIQLPSGDFDIKAHVTSHVNAQAGLMARDVLASAPPAQAPATGPNAPAGTGNWVAIWTRRVASTMDGANPTVANLAATGDTPYLRITRVGNLVTSYYSTDGITYTQAQQRDYSFSATGWGAATYIGLDLSDTTGAVGSAAGTYDEVNFMGTAGSADMSTTDFVLSGGAQLDLGPVVYVNTVSTNGVALTEGCWAGSALSGATRIDPVTFTSTSTGIAVIPSLVPPPPPPAITLCPTDITVNVNEPVVSAVVTFEDPAFTDGLLPVTTTCSPASGSTFPSGTTPVICTVADATCPFGRKATCYFNVSVVVLPPQSTASISPPAPNGDVTITFNTAVGLCYKVQFTDTLTPPSWSEVVGSKEGTGVPESLVDSGATAGSTQRFYRVVQAPGPCPP